MKAVKSNTTRKSTTTTNGPQAPRRKAPPTSPPTTIELRGVPIHFPFKPYTCQEDYMGKVLDALLQKQHALLESPTGTGKTLCLLCATLAWQREVIRQKNNPHNFLGSNKMIESEGGTQKPLPTPTIIYASRTHSQLSQVVRELKNTRYRPKHAVLGSREQMCVHPKVKRAGATAADINHDCNRLGQERKCRFRNKVDGFTPESNEPGAGNFQPVQDMEDLVRMGKKEKVCPFYFTRSRVAEAELIFVPYNYLFDKDARSTTLSDVRWVNAVVIFDEAHNLESFASESASFDLSTTDIAGCIGEIQRAVNYMQTFGNIEDGRASIKAENIAKIKSIFLHLEEYIMTELSQNVSAYRGEFMMEVFQKGANITHANHQLFVKEVQKLTDVFLMFGSSNGSDKNSTRSGGTPRLDHFIQCVKRVFGEETEARCLVRAQSYRVHVSGKQTISSRGRTAGVVGRTISYWCFAPSEAMRELSRLKVRSILVTSGTLSPLDSYALELDIPFPHRLENPHIIPDDQIHVRVVGKGVSNKLLTSSYERRQDDEYYWELGNTLVSLAKVVPGGMLVFFPSYGVMEMCLEKWGGPASRRSDNREKVSGFFAARKRQPTGTARYSFPCAPHTFSASKEVMNPWKRLLGVKSVVVEPKSTVDLPDAISEFHKYLNMPKSRGVALFGVCRGKISEGIDFAHDMCRAVVITGLPFAPSFDPRVKMKREFLDQNRSTRNQKASVNGGFGASLQPANVSLSGHEWYTQQAHRAVNQAVGRVIRNKNDYGAVLLLDNRFSLPANQNGLSKWVRPHIQPDEGMGRTIAGLAKFYKEAAKKAEERDRIALAELPKNPVSMILKYEEEDEPNADAQNDDEFTKVTIVKGEAQHSPSKSGHGASPLKNYIRPDRILATVDLKDEKLSYEKLSGDGTSASKVPKQNENKLAPGIEKHSIQDRKPKISEATAIAKSSQQQKPNPSPAAQFLKLVQKKMTSPEQSIVKKAAVAMKSVDSEENKTQFLKEAGAIIEVVLNHETFENRSRENKPEMLVLLFRLLPEHALVNCQLFAMTKVFDSSSLSTTLKGIISDEAKYRGMRKKVTHLMVRAWYKSNQSTYVTQSRLVADFEIIVTPLLASSNDEFRRNAFSLFAKLFPTELKSPMNATIDHLRASLRISILRAKERKKQLGEASVQQERFRSSVPVYSAQGVENKADHVNVEMASDESPDEQNKDKKRENRIKEEQTKPLNPYAKSLTSSLSSKRDSTANGHANRPEKIPRTASHSKQALERKRPPAQDMLKRILTASASDTFTGQKPRNSFQVPESNAPKTLLCQICENHCKQPMMAPCNHMSCKTCWMLWLNKSNTCPTCRQQATKETLTLVVFKKA